MIILGIDEYEDYVCACGNDILSDGFYTCDSDGNEIEPNVGSKWMGLYVCPVCGRFTMIERDTD